MESALPDIPPKRYFTIGEVSELCGVKPYVLRYWEQEFTQLRPMKRRGNRRYYQHHEVLLIRRIRDLLYDKGFTISGARNRLAELNTAALQPAADEFVRFVSIGDEGFVSDEADPPLDDSAADVTDREVAAAIAAPPAAMAFATRQEALVLLSAASVAVLRAELASIRELLDLP
jgi:DNA-binding transcriptional MerR regulator